MKFFTKSVKSCTARVGTLSEFERIPNSSFETPLALIYTRGGCVPHLTKEVLNMITTNSLLLSVPLSNSVLMTEAMKNTNTNFAKFVGMEEHINLLTIHDPAQLTPSGFRKLDSISLWTRSGRQVLTSNKYMDIVEAFKPDLYVALCDGDTNVDSSRKRALNSVRLNKTLFEQCFSRHSASENLKSVGILAAIEGGYDIEARTSSVDDLKDKPVMGYVIDGLHNNGPSVQNISLEQVKQVVEHTVNLLPVDKPKVSMGCWNPLMVLEFVELGVDVFDTSYPYVATENSEAFTFLCDHTDCNNVGHVISLAEKRYKDEFSPICSQCECLACKNHTRAYLHHLYNTKEMLHTVLLMIHNVHQYLKFFQDIRENIRTGTLDRYKKIISLKFLKHNVT
ncbi:queuine tRNA-ribosyltransferase accessory subunit 2 [Hylaeus anthracinus]|uniref:queuine tRNA-ribosyltransferase accessory subunit 2 n=1 Tax=Hylaeus anthracinus TaxID=313031 RepID=UPI0023B94909|nr:queuine tRNA-ribosyltransferase accessory subunit 2 [Hylaeus anthracinus]